SYLGVTIARLSIAFIIAPKLEPFMGLISAGDIFERLFGRRAKTLMGVSTILESVLMSGLQVLALSQIMQYFFGVQPSVAAIVSSIIIIIYSFRGGIRSVTATDVFQFGIMIVAIPIMCAVAIAKIGGYSELFSVIKQKGAYFAQPMPGDWLKHTAAFIAFSLPCLYPVCIQRMLMAKSPQQVKKTFVITGILSFLFNITVGCIGVAAFVLLPNIDHNHAFSGLIDLILPVGIKGLIIAGLLAIFMSTIDSILNVGAVAVTHDLIGSVVTKPLAPKTALRVARLSSVLMALGSILIALIFTNVFEVMFFIMVVGDSVFFPGFFLGLLGFKPRIRDFWLGVGISVTIVLVGHFWLNLFQIYTMLIAISCNMAVLLASCYLNSKKISEPNKKAKSLKLVSDPFFELKKSSFAISTSSYCDIFSTLILINSLLPFFFQVPYAESFPLAFLIISVLAACCAVLLILRQALVSVHKKIFSWVWHATIFLGLSFHIAYILLQPNFGIINIADFITVVALLSLLLKRKELFLHLCLSAFCAVFTSLLPSSIFTITISEFRTWSFFIHSLALVLCLFLFRKRDIAAYQFMTTKFAHETGRTLSAFSSSAKFLDKYLPVLIETHKAYAPTQINDRALMRLETIAQQLIVTSERSQQNLKAFLALTKIDNSECYISPHSIMAIVTSALNDLSVPKQLKAMVEIKNTHDFIFLGHGAQITQVVINLLENAEHATDKCPDAKITIWTKNNCLYVEDTGEGIAKGILPNIFDDFFSTKGTAGQGLAFCKLVMENHGGEISCESTKGEFTRFTIRFPIYTGEPLIGNSKNEHDYSSIIYADSYSSN
ncbi:hypothetical protein E6Q11_03740, partial [Candidatus Dojkabacteria bacterium]